MNTILNNWLKSKNQKGIIFSFDAMISFTITLFSIFGLIYFISINYENQKEEFNQFYLTEKTLLISDSLVKNNNPQNYLLGSAIINLDKKRVKSNELKKEYLLKIEKFEVGNFFLKTISWQNGFESKIINLNEKSSKNCLTSKRFVLIDGIKSIIELTGCLVE